MSLGIKLSVLRPIGAFLALTALLWAVPAPLPAAEVNLSFFHSECRECEETAYFLNALKTARPCLKVNEYPLEVEENYLLLLKIEKYLGAENAKNAPVSIFVLTNAYYGFSEITNALPARVAALEEKGAPLIDPSDASTAEELSAERMKSFTLTSVLINGLLDGINPCAFATLILFISLLSVYGTSKKEIVVTGLTFTLAVFLTYLALGLGFLNVIKALAIFPKIKFAFDVALIIFCLVCAALSIKDAITVKRSGTGAKESEDLTLKLPPRLRSMITKILSSYAGKKRWLFGVFLAGFLVSLLESVCTGQVYIPTINLIIKNNPAQVTAWLWLVFYNSLFALPLVVLTFLAAFGLRSQFMLKVQRKGAFPIRIGMALLFLFMAALLIAQLR